MKIRNGFVSNSSSASFIVTWQVSSDTEECYEQLYRVISNTLYPFLGMETDPKRLKVVHDDLEFLIANTEELHPLSIEAKKAEELKTVFLKAMEEDAALFRTTCNIDMYNDSNDFHPAFIRFLFALQCNAIKGGRRNGYSIEIISQEIKDTS